MLVIPRKKNESIVINDDITIVIIEIRGDKVRLGVEAPKEVPVMRGEVHDAIRGRIPRFYLPDAPVAQKKRAASPDDDLQATALAAVSEVKSASYDGFRCPECQSAEVRIEQIKLAYRGAELVRRRQCDGCGHRFYTLEKVQDL